MKILLGGAFFFFFSVYWNSTMKRCHASQERERELGIYIVKGFREDSNSGSAIALGYMLYLINAGSDNSSSLVGCMSICVYVTLPLSIIRFPTTLKDNFKVRYNKRINIWQLHFALDKVPGHLSIISSKLDKKFNNNNDHLKRSTYPHLGHVCQNLRVEMYFSHFKLQLIKYNYQNLPNISR